VLRSGDRFGDQSVVVVVAGRAFPNPSSAGRGICCNTTCRSGP